MKNTDEIQLQHLKIFVTVKEVGSMTAAAKLLDKSQSGISQSIRTLEKALGTQLFDRDIRPLAPTSAGFVLYDHACKIMTEVGRTIELVRTTAMLPQRQLNIGIIDSFVGAVGSHLFANIGKIAHHYKVWSGLGSDLERNLIERQIDILIAGENIDGMPNDMVNFELLTEPYVLAVPGDWKESETGLDLLSSDQKFIRYSQRSEVGKQIEQHLERIKVSPERCYEFDDSDSVLGLVGGGLGWAITTPLCCLQAKGRLHKIRILPLPKPGMNRRILLFIRDEQFRRIGERISIIGQAGIRLHCIPEIKEFAAWALPKVIVGKTTSYAT